MTRIENIKGYSIEKLVDYIHFNKIKVGFLIEKVKKSNLIEEDKTGLVKRIKIAKSRLEQPLDFQHITLFIVFPFGITSIFTNDNDSDYKQFVRYNYKKKIKQYFWFSLLGFAMYIILALTIALVRCQ